MTPSNNPLCVASRKYYDAHRVDILQRKRERRASDPEYRDSCRANSKKWSKANPEKNRNYMRKRLKVPRHRINHLIGCAKRRAKANDVYFDLSINDLLPLPEVCEVFGITLKYSGGKHFQSDSASLDRLYPSKGYIAGNVRIISLRANILKRDGTIEELKKVLSYMEKHLCA